MRKVLFLDVDGVMNSEETLKRKVHRFQGVVGIDPYLSLLVNRIIEATGCEVVLSSAWRHGRQEDFDYIEGCIGHKILDKTGSCCSGIRGVEIYNWISKNIPWEERNDREKFCYAILDDDGDMLLWQKDNFFQTDNKVGITEEIAARITEHLLGTGLSP